MRTKFYLSVFFFLQGTCSWSQSEISNDSSYHEIPDEFHFLIAMNPVPFDLVTQIEIWQDYVTAEYASMYSKFVNLESCTITLPNNTPDSIIQQIRTEFGKLKHLDFLSIYVDSNQIVPDIFSNCQNLRSLNFRGNYFMKFPKSISKMKFLKELTIHCPTIKHLPKSINKFSNLNYLVLENKKIKHLPRSFSRLKKLGSLSINSEKLKRIPNSYSSFDTLLDLSCHCPKLKKLPKSFKNLIHLQVLRLYGVPQLKKLPRGLGLLPDLREVVVTDAQKLSSLESLKNAPVLNRLTIIRAKGTIVTDVLATIPKLKYLELGTKEVLLFSEDQIASINSSQIQNIHMIDQYWIMEKNGYYLKTDYPSEEEKILFKKMFPVLFYKNEEQ